MSKFSLDDGVGETWEKLRDDNDGSVDWMLVGYTSKTACAVKACGVGGRTQCLAAIEPGDAIVFGAFRVTAIDERENTTSRRTKFCVFMFTSPNAPVMQRAKAGSHKTDVWRVMAGSHVQFQMDNLEDMSEAEIVKKLRACGGAHQPTGFDFGAGDVGEGAAGETAAKPRVLSLRDGPLF
ncbi:hypothetical protein M885DRAFT_463322 [Pelagophyceae sp. CCMP2097]|nr:hypothetical protein M885DRAFT_463322 [Pelagophyceae sp. CCMP2097]